MPDSHQQREFWPEQCEANKNYEVTVAPWLQLLKEENAMRAILYRERDMGKPSPVGQNHLNRRKYGTVPSSIQPEQFDLHNIHCYMYLPSVYEECEKFANFATKLMSIPEERREPYSDQVRHEIVHSLYHHTMWRRYGRKVYVLDDTTYTLLAETPLPDLPASILAAPEHSFYLKLPKGAFQFGVYNPHTEQEDVQNVEGIMVALDKIDPDHPGVRELTYMVVGEGPSPENRNIAFISIGLGPDALLSEVGFSNPHRMETVPEVLKNTVISSKNTGAEKLGITSPRVILGFLLYLQSEHPDVEPIAPAPRRNFKEIKSEKQKEAALRNQAQRLRGVSRLPILYVGRHLAEEIEAEKAVLKEFADRGDETARRFLDHPVWVRGHTKRQRFGPGHKAQKIIWIRPYMKGPDTAEFLKARAAKVQRAQHRPPHK